MIAILPHRLKLRFSQMLIGGAVFLHATPLLAAEEEGSEEPEWVLSYALIMLTTMLAIFLIVRSSRRSERATEEKYEVKGIGDLLKKAKPAKKRGKQRGKVQDHPEANSALIFSILGLLCCGILAVIGLIKGLKVKKEIQSDPRVTGEEKALAAIIISSIAILLWILSTIVAVIQILAAGG